jgi:hypothetical protein
VVRLVAVALIDSGTARIRGPGRRAVVHVGTGIVHRIVAGDVSVAGVPVAGVLRAALVPVRVDDLHGRDAAFLAESSQLELSQGVLGPAIGCSIGKQRGSREDTLAREEIVHRVENAPAGTTRLEAAVSVRGEIDPMLHVILGLPEEVILVGRQNRVPTVRQKVFLPRHDCAAIPGVE